MPQQNARQQAVALLHPEYLNSNITMLKWMISEGYGDARTLARRVEAMEKWLENPSLLRADEDAEYAHVIEIDMLTKMRNTLTLSKLI